MKKLFYYDKLKQQRKFMCTIEENKHQLKLDGKVHFPLRSQSGWKLENKAIER